MRVSSGSGIARDFRREPDRADHAAPAGTALVPVSRPDNGETGGGYRQPRILSAFVAQLIAKSQDVPHLRERRRAGPAEAANTYGKMMNLGGVPERHKARPY